MLKNIIEILEVIALDLRKRVDRQKAEGESIDKQVEQSLKHAELLIEHQRVLQSQDLSRPLPDVEEQQRRIVSYAKRDLEGFPKGFMPFTDAVIRLYSNIIEELRFRRLQVIKLEKERDLYKKRVEDAQQKKLFDEPGLMRPRMVDPT